MSSGIIAIDGDAGCDMLLLLCGAVLCLCKEKEKRAKEQPATRNKNDDHGARANDPTTCIKLCSADGQQFEVSREVASESRTVKHVTREPMGVRVTAERKEEGQSYYCRRCAPKRTRRRSTTAECPFLAAIRAATSSWILASAPYRAHRRSTMATWPCSAAE